MVSNDNIEKIESTFEKFLKRHAIPKGTPGNSLSHTSMWGGNYMITGMDYIKFMEYFMKLPEESKSKYSIVERHPADGISALVFDIDLEYPDKKKFSERRITDKHIKIILKSVMKNLLKYVNIDKSKLDAYIYMKHDVERRMKGKEYQYKDGIHVYLPNVVISTKIKYFILDKTFHELMEKDALKSLKMTNSYKEIIDPSVAYNNGMMMIGCPKRGQKHPYKFYARFDGNYDKHDEEDLSEMPMILSLRLHNEIGESTEYTFKEEYMSKSFKKALDEIYMKYCSKTERENIKNEQNKKTKDKPRETDDGGDENDRKTRQDAIDAVLKAPIKICVNDYEYEQIKRLLFILKPSRCEEYSEWIRIVWLLHNLGGKDDKRMCELMHEWSKQSSKYDRDRCNKEWNNATDTGYGRPTLNKWAEEDDKEKFGQIMQEFAKDKLKEAMDSGTDVAFSELVYHLYHHRYKCTMESTGRGVSGNWYKFESHRWVVDQSESLKSLISDEVKKICKNYYASKCAALALMDDEDEILLNKKKNDNMFKIIRGLGNEAKLASIFRSCERKFVDNDFGRKVDDTNKHLIGFNNGVYDLDAGEFRAGEPDDLITFTVGYDYKEFSEKDPTVKQIRKFFKQVQPKKKIRGYIYRWCSSLLNGKVKNQHFVIWIGGGGNGKSIALTLLNKTLGDYADILPIECVTRPRGGANDAKPFLANKKGKRLASMVESNRGDKLYCAEVKVLSGGDEITCRPLFGAPFKFVPQFKLLTLTNDYPEISDATDRGTWRRMKIVRWLAEFVEGCDFVKGKKNMYLMDKDLPEKVEKWNQAFMWMLLKKYYPKYVKEGLDEPEEIKFWTDAYNKDSDLYREFLDKMFEQTKDKGDRVKIDDAYEKYKDWIGSAYTKDKIAPRRTFIRELEKKDLTIKNDFIIGIKKKEFDDFNS